MSDVARSYMEWAVRTADGYIDGPQDDRLEAEEQVREYRECALKGHALQYAGAEVVGRRVSVTAWHTLDERCPGHALSECLACEWVRD